MGLHHDHMSRLSKRLECTLESLHGNEAKYTSLLDVIITEDDTARFLQPKVQLLENLSTTILIHKIMLIIAECVAKKSGSMDTSYFTL